MKLFSQQFHARDEFAYTCLYNQYADTLLAYGIGLGFEKETVKDAIHDVFLKLYFNRESLKDIDNLKFYLLRMLKNRLLDILKTTVDTSDIGIQELNFSITTTILDELIGDEERLALQNKIEKLLSCLTDRQREAIYLRYMQEMSYDEIAGLLKMTPQATRKLIFRAMERMRELDLVLFYFFYIFIFFISKR
ncbi:DNA-directed RNA polymerase sigma-70 factor [Bacteroidia bacterium]|nr:DNA-directed RNA polymerase sigma-70 factor [Bacteroidia bacterium]